MAASSVTRVLVPAVVFCLLNGFQDLCTEPGQLHIQHLSTH
jgi:hypothetical protein